MSHEFIIVFIGAKNLDNFIQATDFITIATRYDLLKTDTIHRVNNDEKFKNETLERIVELCDNIDIFFIHDNERVIKIADEVEEIPGYVDKYELNEIKREIYKRLEERGNKVEYYYVRHPLTNELKKIRKPKKQKCTCIAAMGIDLSNLELIYLDNNKRIEDEALYLFINPFIEKIKKWKFN